MASWDDLAQYLRSNYKISKDEGTFMVLAFDLGGGRSQDVMVSRGHMDASRQEWASIASGFVEVGSADLPAVLSEAAEFVVGGVVAYGSTLAYRHAVPLATLDLDEFTEPFSLVMRTADALEQKFSGGDRF